MFCSTCGAQLAPHANFCSRCGTAVAGAPYVPSGMPPVQAMPVAPAARACFACGGSGKVHRSTMPHGPGCIFCQVCNGCGGTGAIPGHASVCPHCRGEGKYHDSPMPHSSPGCMFCTECATCHQPVGQGLANKYPPLAHSDFLNADKNQAIRVLLHGRQGEIVVNGVTYNNTMPAFPLGDEDIANALTYTYNSFGNSGKEVTPDEVKVLRAEKYTPPAPVKTAPSQFE